MLIVNDHLNLFLTYFNKIETNFRNLFFYFLILKVNKKKLNFVVLIKRFY